jgi:hypothetical protein
MTAKYQQKTTTKFWRTAEKMGAQHTLTTKDKKKNDMKEAEWSRR